MPFNRFGDNDRVRRMRERMRRLMEARRAQREPRGLRQMRDGRNRGQMTNWDQLSPPGGTWGPGGNINRQPVPDMGWEQGMPQELIDRMRDGDLDDNFGAGPDEFQRRWPNPQMGSQLGRGRGSKYPQQPIQAQPVPWHNPGMPSPDLSGGMYGKYGGDMPQSDGNGGYSYGSGGGGMLNTLRDSVQQGQGYDGSGINPGGIYSGEQATDMQQQPTEGNPYSPTQGQGFNLQNMLRRKRNNYSF